MTSKELVPEQKVAKLIQSNLPEFRGDAGLYRCTPPLEGHEYIIASGVYDDFGGNSKYPLHECFLFPANEQGEVVDWGELPGSTKGTTDHTEAFAAAGYETIGVIKITGPVKKEK